MDKEFSNTMSAFWTSVMDKLNTKACGKSVITSVIKDVCRYFNFGCSFIYTFDYRHKAVLYSAYRAYLDHEHLHPQLDLPAELGDWQYKEFCRARRVSFDHTRLLSPLEKQLAELFRAQSLIIVPIRTAKGELCGFTGMADRRGEIRGGDQDLTFAYYILVVIGNYLKILLTQDKAKEAYQTLSNILDNTGVQVCVLDYYTKELLYANQLFRQNGVDDFAGFGLDMAEVKVSGNTNIWNHQQPDGSWRRYMSTAFYWTDGRLAQVISGIDVTQSVTSLEKIRHFARYDMLTGLLNRHSLLLDCDEAIEQLKSSDSEQKPDGKIRTARQGCLIFCDLNKFKEVNDERGHQAGDELLQKIGEYFNRNELTKGRVYRYAGDEFVILCMDRDRGGAEAIIHSVEADFAKPWQLSDGPVQCTISTGITCYPDDAQTTSDLLHNADLAMYEEKRQ